MRVIRDDIWLCVDCLFVAVNDDDSGIEDDKRRAEVRAAVGALGPHLVPDFDTESGEGHRAFSWHGCDCCGSKLGGELHRFAILGPDDKSDPQPLPDTIPGTLGPFHDCKRTEGAVILAKVDFFGVPHWAELIQVRRDATGCQVGTDDHAEAALAAAYSAHQDTAGSAFATVKLPGLPGDWIVIVSPTAD